MITKFTRTSSHLAVSMRSWPRRIHRDQRGTISILSVFTAMLLTMLLGMVMNVGRQVDGKIRMQNSADASAYSGGVVLTRGMNTLAFTNHLLCDVFALTAFLREARDGNAQSHTADILAAWSETGPVFAGSGFAKFDALGVAIIAKIPLEQRLVDSYSAWVAESSARILPLMEEILAEELIPQYQRSVVEAFPDIAQAAAREAALRNGRPARGRGDMLGSLWRTSAVPLGGEYELLDRTLPVIDPVMDVTVDQAQYMATSRRQRRELSYRYLNQWNYQTLYIFDRQSKMCQFGSLWRSYTCGHLKHLLEVEYPNRNLLHVIRTERSEVTDSNAHLDQNFSFLATVHWQKLPEMLPGLFENPMDNDAVAFTEVRMFVPRPRLEWRYYNPSWSSPPMGGVPGDFPPMPGINPPEPDEDDEGYWTIRRQPVPSRWDLLNQHWMCQLVPVTQSGLATILQTPPPASVPEGQELVLPDLGGLSSEDLGRISPH